MCGIAGILDLRGRGVGRPQVERLCARLVHRGPDEGGAYADGPVALGQRRLSIIDLSGGHQPMGNEDGTVWITFNGEIYNFQELRPELERQGHRFATSSDTEVILHAYEQHGEDCLSRFRGMFAFAIWDANRRRLFLARDRVGKKPLFYAEADGQFVFASELQALLQHPGVSRELDPAAVDDYLTYGYVPAPATAFRGVYKLPPAHHLTIQLDDDGAGVRERKVGSYWSLDYLPKLDLDEEDAADALEEVLTEAVRLRMVADVPLGALLSGGVDSSVVVALMSRLSPRPVKTFSIGFDEKGFNELPYARMVAQALRHRPPRADRPGRRAGGHPDARAALRRAVRRLVGDPELLRRPAHPAARHGGAQRRRGRRELRGLRPLLGRGPGRPVSEAPRGAAAEGDRAPGGPRPRLAAGEEPAGTRHAVPPGGLGAARPALPPVGHVLLPGAETPPLHARVPGEPGGARGEGLAPEPARRAAPWRRRGLDAILAADVRSYLPYDLLVKMDIATMANSLEARSPFLDHKVMEFAARLPSRHKIRGSTQKYLLKKLARKLLPAECLDRRKMGFGVPVGSWMRGPLRPLLEDVLLSPTHAGRGLFEPEAVRGMVRAHVEGAKDNTYRLWSLFWLELWMREFLP